MFKYDFVILYEHRNRELENAVLIAMMLEKKGYKVAIEFRRSARRSFQKAEVLIVPFFYNNKTVVDFAINPFYQFRKVINMQYEQVFTIEGEESRALIPVESARLAYHVAWGDIPKRLMIENGINDKNIYTVGHISMDLNYKKYDKVFLDRNKIAQKYNLPKDKKWHLFISSFSCVGISNEEKQQWSEICDDIYDYTELCEKSQNIVLKWFDSVLNETDDYIIYRPHPHEVESERIKKLSVKHKNFICISDYSIRQWIRVCDSIYTWCSTSIVDVYYAKKKCCVIRPIPFPRSMEYRLYLDQEIINCYEDFKKSILNVNEDHDVVGTTIDEYYSNFMISDSFMTFVDMCEDVYKNRSKVDFKRKFKYSHLTVIKIFIYNILMSIAGVIDYSKIAPSKYRADIFHSHREMHDYIKEIKVNRKRFARIKKYE